ncbi:MAG TPA: PEP/pyruvate-binding domain-containing protein, partial [Vicinamibacteria bacterium]|nr:PEP/pyruvate-binding domain-containing protein [Vicinamibacteria bacterium]
MALRIVSLDGLDPAAAAPFGGKAAGLARLRGMGAAVPDAVLVTATDRPPASWSAGERSRLRSAAEPLLRRGRLAVRSSAIGEDSAQRSFAGLFESVLGVADLDALEEAAARCIASAASERVRAYVGTGPPIEVGLVVQRQVEARAAGVCFTRDPTGADGAILIEAVAGLGDRLVSGHARPQRWRVYLNGFGVLEARGEGPAVLEESEARAIACAARDLEARHGHPVDL